VVGAAPEVCGTEPDQRRSTMTDTVPTAAALGAVDRYVAFWNAGTPAEQSRLAAETFADDVRCHVPIGVMRGAEELIGFRDRFAQHAPDYAFRPRSEPEAHHDRARLQWEIVTGAGTFATGTDVLEVDASGRIAAVTGFLDRAPEGFDPDAHH
jgi:hypothetical protein